MHYKLMPDVNSAKVAKFVEGRHRGANADSAAVAVAKVVGQ
jgi:hypothetical protein